MSYEDKVLAPQMVPNGTILFNSVVVVIVSVVVHGSRSSRRVSVMTVAAKIEQIK